MTKFDNMECKLKTEEKSINNYKQMFFFVLNQKSLLVTSTQDLKKPI